MDQYIVLHPTRLDPRLMDPRVVDQGRIDKWSEVRNSRICGPLINEVQQIERMILRSLFQ